VTDKNDVYSFGVVLLELISGRKAVIAKDLDIVQWARGYTKNNLGSISMMADPQIAVSVNGFGPTFSKLLRCGRHVRKLVTRRDSLGFVVTFLFVI
jgi:hypothetical protein